MTRDLPLVAAIGAAICALTPAPALTQSEGPAGYVEDIESDAPAAAGVDDEIDDTATEAEAIERGGAAAAGLSRRRVAQVEEIVVQARRRAELIEDTPISVTAIGAETLVQAQVTRFQDLQFLVPNMETGPGRSGSADQASIRGVGGTESGNPGVGLYVDGVFLLLDGGNLLNIVDIAQVEVLRGPQGTLFGKNTLGGAINYTTAMPDDTLAGSTWIRAGRFGSVDTRTTLSVPVKVGALEDKLFTRWSFASSNSDGYVYNENTDEYHSGRDALWVLGKARLLATDELEINASGIYNQSQSNGAGARCGVVEEAAASLRGLLLAAAPDFYEKCAASQPYRFGTNQQMLYQTKVYGMWGNATYGFGDVGFFDDLNVKLLGSWMQRKARLREDVDYTEDEIIHLTNLNIGDVFGQPESTEASLVEAQTFGTALDGDLTAVAGFFSSWKSTNRADVIRTTGGTLDNVGGFTVGPTDQNDQDWAFYGQATWSPLDWLSLTGGIRYTSERREVSRETIFPVGDGSTTDPVVTSSGSGAKTFTQWTPMGSLQLFAPDDLLGDAPIDHVMGYFTYAQGFSSGGFNAVVGTGTGGGLIPFDPATLDNYEIGLKTVGLDQRATLNISLFYMNYDDIQVTQARTIEVPGQEIPETARIIVNATSAVLKGIEADMLLRPIEGLQIMGNVGILDSTYGNFPDISGLDSVTEINREGQTFGGPYWTTFVAAQYSFEVDVGASWLDGYLTPRVDWYYQDEANTTVPEDPSGWLNGYSLVNARLSYDFLDDRAQVALWGRNLADEQPFGGGGGTTGFFGYAARMYRAPITFGGEISYRFAAG